MSAKNTLLLLLLLLSSCAYRWQSDDKAATVCVPFIVGDEDGSLTAEVIRVLNRTSGFSVVTSGGDIRLKASILSTGSDIIGFRLNNLKIKSKITKKNLIACEGRKNLCVEVTLLDGSSDQVLHGPYVLVADQDYDYVDGDSLEDLVFSDSEGNQVTVLSFSLGQLESCEAAQAAASRPLYGKIAQKIVDSISAAW